MTPLTYELKLRGCGEGMVQNLEMALARSEFARKAREMLRA